MPFGMNALAPGNTGIVPPGQGGSPFPQFHPMGGVMTPGGGGTGAPLQGGPQMGGGLPPQQVGMVPGVPGSMGTNSGGPMMTPGGGGTGAPLQGPGGLQAGQMPLGGQNHLMDGPHDPSQWRNLPGYGMLSMLQRMQTQNPDIFNHMLQSHWAQKFGITADNLGTMESRQQARSDAFGGNWQPPQLGLPTPQAPPATIAAPVASQAPVNPASSYQLPTY